MKEEDRKAIVFVLDDAYADPARVAIRDVWTYSGKKYPVYILHTGALSDASKSKILHDMEKVGAAEDTVRFMNVAQQGKIFADLKKRNHIGVIAYAKLLMDELLWTKENITTAYYFDVDILVLRDLKKLFSIVPKKAIAVVDHNSDADHERLLNKKGWYINTGVIVANLPRWSSMNAREKFRDAISAHGDKFIYADQDALMIVFDGEIEKLPSIYNFMLSPRFNPQVKHVTGRDWDPDEVSPAIVHFIGPKKPWNETGPAHSFKVWRDRRKTI